MYSQASVLVTPCIQSIVLVKYMISSNLNSYIRRTWSKISFRVSFQMYVMFALSARVVAECFHNREYADTITIWSHNVEPSGPT